MSLGSLEYTAVPKQPCSQHSRGDSYRISSNILLFSLGTHAWIHSFEKIFPFYLLLGPCLSLCTFLLCLFLYHTQPKLSGSLLKPFAAPLCLDPYLRAAIQYLMPPLNSSTFSFPLITGEKIPLLSTEPQLSSLSNSSFKTNFSFKTLFCPELQCKSAAAERILPCDVCLAQTCSLFLLLFLREIVLWRVNLYFFILVAYVGHPKQVIN